MLEISVPYWAKPSYLFLPQYYGIFHPKKVIRHWEVWNPTHPNKSHIQPFNIKQTGMEGPPMEGLGGSFTLPRNQNGQSGTSLTRNPNIFLLLHQYKWVTVESPTLNSNGLIIATDVQSSGWGTTTKGRHGCWGTFVNPKRLRFVKFEEASTTEPWSLDPSCSSLIKICIPESMENN